MADRSDTREAQTAWFCSHDGYSPKNRGNWCDLGCGSDYNRMIGVPARHVTKLTAALEAERATLREALRDDLIAWEHDADGWRVLLRHFESLPDVDLWDSKELIAAIQGRLDAIAERVRFSSAALVSEEDA